MQRPQIKTAKSLIFHDDHSTDDVQESPFDLTPSHTPRPSSDQPPLQPAPDASQRAIREQAAPVGGLASATAEGQLARKIPAVDADAKEYYGTEVHSRARTYSTVRSFFCILTAGIL